MTAPNMATITAYLERSLQKCSLNHHHQSSSSSGAAEFLRSSSSDSPENYSISNNSDTALDLNSQNSLPYHWEQCLDLKSGEVYYINWRTGMKSKEDPRRRSRTSGDLDFYSEEEEEEDDDDSSSNYDSEGSSSESSPSYSREQEQQLQCHNNNNNDNNSSSSSSSSNDEDEHVREQQVLVVAGCKSCLMYFMVPKQVEDCPKCTGQLLHFDRSE